MNPIHPGPPFAIRQAQNTITLLREGQPLAEISLPFDCQPLEPDRQPEFVELFGAGKRLRWAFEPQAGLRAELWLSVYNDLPFVLLGGRLAATGPAPVLVEDITTCDIVLRRDSHAQSRFLINSGSQGFSGSLPLDAAEVAQSAAEAVAASSETIDLVLTCSTLCAFRGATPDDCLVAGFITVRRAEAFFGRRREGDVFRIQPRIAYDQVQLDRGEALTLETMMLVTDRTAGRALETWADAVAAVLRPQFSRSMLGLYNTWYAYWTPTSDHGDAALWVRGTQELVESGLIHYGIAGSFAGVHHNRAAFGEPEPWPGHFPDGFGPPVREIRARGGVACGGVFWGHVSKCSSLFEQHPEFMIKDADGQPLEQSPVSWGACPHPFYDLDLTDPEAFECLRRVAPRPFAELGIKYFLMDFMGLASRRSKGARPADPKVCWPVEAERRQLSMFKEELGEGAMIGVYTSPTNRFAGLVDRVRLSKDAGVITAVSQLDDAGRGNLAHKTNADFRWEWTQDVARNMAAGYFYNEKLWINDPDPISVGIDDEPQTLEEARVRIMICACSGGFPTVGEPLSRMHPNRMAMLKQALPAYGHAYRCLDLMDQTVPSIHHLHVPQPGGPYELLALFNWNDEPRRFDLDLEAMDLFGAHHGFDFWEQAPLGVLAGRFNHTVPPRAARLLRLTPLAARPQLIGTDRHVTVGALEVGGLCWDAASANLRGVARRPLPETGTLFFAVPEDWSLLDADGLNLRQEDGIVRLELEFTPTGAPWRLAFAPAAGAVGASQAPAQRSLSVSN